MSCPHNIKYYKDQCDATQGGPYMTRKRYLRLKEAETAGKLRIGETANCPYCGRPNCCRSHAWVNRSWWEKSKPYIEQMMQLSKKY